MKFEVDNHQLTKIIFEPSDFGGEYDFNRVIDIKIPEKVDGSYIRHIGQVGKPSNSLLFSYEPGYTANPIINHERTKFHIDTLEIPNGVISINSYAFIFCDINKLVLPDTLQEINGYSFFHCSIFSDIVLPPALERIETCAFMKTTFHGTITCPASLKYIGPGAFQQTNLKKILFNEKTKTLSLKDRAFYESTIEEVSFPKNLASLAPHSFCSCNQLRRVTFALNSKKIKLIPKYCFQRCGALTTVENIPVSVTKINERAFSHTRLTGIDLVSSRVETIDRCAFAYTEITSFIAPATLKRIGCSAFSNCRRLKMVKLPYPSWETFADSVFSSCHALESVEFDEPECCLVPAYIPSRMFISCTSLENFAWPKQLFAIGDASFGRTAIKEIDVSEACDTIAIHPSAFMECSIQKIMLNPFAASIQIKAFEDVLGIKDTELLDKAKEDLIF